MRQKLLFVFFLFVFGFSNSQQFSIESLQSEERIETALDSVYIWLEKGNTVNFIKNYNPLNEAIKKSKNEEFRARFNSYNAVLYFYLYDYDKFNSYLNKALNYYKNSDNSEMLIYVYTLKSLYEKFKNKDDLKSIEWNLKVFDLVDINDEKLERVLIDLYYRLTISYYEINDWNNTFQYANKAIDLAKKRNIRTRLMRMYFYKGMALFKKKDINGAIKNLKLSETILKESELATGRKQYYNEAAYLDGFSKVYKDLGDYKKSINYLTEYKVRMEESLYPTIESIAVKIKSDSDLLVTIAKQNEEKAEKELKKSELLYYILAIGITTLIISGLLILIFQQRKHKKLNIKKNSLLTSKNNELIAVKEEVENALKVKTDFLNSITHELRTSLYAINSITHLIKENKERKIDDSQMDILSFSGDHLLRFINDVIDFNLGANNFEIQNLKLEKNNLKTLLDKIKKTIKFSLVMDNDNNFVFDFDPAISQNLKIDSLKLSRIIINLLNNASKYTQEGEITFTVKQLKATTKTSSIEFCIKDTGIGITKEQLNEIKVAFKNNQDLIKRIDNKASGLGMGLVMVNRLLKLYNSELFIESKEGSGTTMSFNITFNIDTSTSDLPEYTLTKSTKTKRHILIVDDNKINQLVTSKIIKKLGHTYNVAGGGKEAISLFKEKNKYDFVLMDIMMPEIDGFEATKIIKSINPEQKIIALTAMSTRENKQEFINFGFNNVIEKPFIMEKFKALIE